MIDSNFGGKCFSLPYQAADAVHFAAVCGVYEGTDYVATFEHFQFLSQMK